MTEKGWSGFLLDGCQVCGAHGQTNRDTEPYRTRLCLAHQNLLDRALMQSARWIKFHAVKDTLYATTQCAARNSAEQVAIPEAIARYYEVMLELHDFIAATIADMKVQWQKEHPDNG